MIELLGIGVARGDDGWLLHRVCARIESARLTLLVAADPAERRAFIDVITARRIPEEGGVWVDRLHVRRETRWRIRTRVAAVDPSAPFAAGRSVLWNVLRGGRGLGGLLRLPSSARRSRAGHVLEAVGLARVAREPVGHLDAAASARLALARALVDQPTHLVVREADAALKPDEVDALGDALHRLARTERVSILVSPANPAALLGHADHLVVLADGLMVYEGAPAVFRASAPPRARLRLG